MMERSNCEICGTLSGLAWTDSHGVAQCVRCGAPYRIYHYDEEKHRVDKPAELLLDEENAGISRAFHADTGARLSATGMGLSFPGGYDVARNSDAGAWNDWIKRHPEHRRDEPTDEEPTS